MQQTFTSHQLLLLRHGKSDWSVGVDDFHRPLINRGKRGAERIGLRLLQQALQPDLIISSPAVRAKVTAQMCCMAMGLDARRVDEDRRIYAAGLSEQLKVLRTVPEQTRRLMLVGHNPGMEMLLSWLAQDEIPLPEDGKLMPTATLARLSFNCPWSEIENSCARLESITRPGSLPEKFPFPSPDGNELRDRPAYYYTQSSVIPYRLRDKKIEILCITSNKKKNWVLPKGIKDPGFTLPESAAIEALEEAGVEGIVSENAIGSYNYTKWNATCRVEVYPMVVTKIVPEKERLERHRKREWLSPEEAQARLKQKALKPMIRALSKQFAKL